MEGKCRGKGRMRNQSLGQQTTKQWMEICLLAGRVPRSTTDVRCQRAVATQCALAVTGSEPDYNKASTAARKHITHTSIAILSSSFKAMPNSYAVTLAMRLMLLPFLPSHIDLFLGRPFFLHSSDDLATTTDAFDFDQELSDSTCFFSSQCSLL
jgi:hypothetical protein